MFFRSSLNKFAYRLKGDDASKYEDECNAMASAGMDALEGVQRSRLADLLYHAYRNVPYYRKVFSEMGVDCAGDLNSIAFDSLPVLRRGMVRKEFVNLQAEDRKRKTVKRYTSGSSGNPICIVKDADQHKWHLASKQRLYRMYGCSLEDRGIVFVGKSQSLRTRMLRFINDLVVGRMRVDVYENSPGYYDSVIRKMKRTEYRVISGYPSAISEFCKYCNREGFDLKDLGILLIVPTAEMLSEDQKKLMEEVFNAPVMNEYGCIETGSVAFACKYGNMHIMNDIAKVEVLDETGVPCEDGTVGRIAITPLFARAMPLIRYQNGDLGSITRESCKCGFQKGFPVLDKIVGREMDYIMTSDGRTVHASVISYAAKDAMQKGFVDEYQAVQKAPGHLEIKYVADGNGASRFIDKLAESLNMEFGNSLEIRCAPVNRIQRERSGKFKYFINEIETGQ